MLVLLAAATLLFYPGPVRAAPLPLTFVADVALSGGPTRLDYESLDPTNGMLYLAHMGDGALIAFDTSRRKVVATIHGMPLVRGVLVVPKLQRVFAAAEGSSEVVVVDEVANRIVARIGVGNVDGLAYDPETERVFVSDESGQRDVVIDARTNKVVCAIELGGEAGNTLYDVRSKHILVAVQTRNQLVAIDPRRCSIVSRYDLPGSAHSHGIALDSFTNIAYIAGEGNSSVIAFDLRAKRVTATSLVGHGVDVLAVDEALGRLYVASESGVISVFDISSGHLTKIGQALLADNAHVVAVDPKTHLVYFPLRDVQGRPVLRIMAPAGR